MINLSINSACNNNCEYCFQKDSYHRLDKEMSLEEVVSFLDNWCVGVARIGIMGGEPTLHPYCAEICTEVSKRHRTALFSNLLCELEVLDKLIRIPSMNWLVNTTTRAEHINIFYRNMDYISKQQHIPHMIFGITLTGNFDVDSIFIDNLLKIGESYPQIVKNYRVSLAAPCHDKEYKLIKYDDSVKMLYEETQKRTPQFKIAFDCIATSCQLSPGVMEEILNDSKTVLISSSCNCTSMCVMVDGKIGSCFSAPEEFFDGKKYHDFKNWKECHKYILEVKNNFIKKYNMFCKTCTKCQDVNCKGVCFASMAHLVIQEKRKNKITQGFNKLKYKILNRNM